MTLLGNKFNTSEDENIKVCDQGKTRIIIKDNTKEISFKKSLVLSTILHPVSVAFIWLSMILLAFLGINFQLFDKPKPKPKDIEFVLVTKPGQPINKNTKNRSDMDSRAGGKHDPTRKESMPTPSAPKSVSQTKASMPAANQANKTVKPKQQVKQTITQNRPKAQESAKKAPTVKKSTTQAPRPNIVAQAPKPTSKPSPNKFAVPVPKYKAGNKVGTHSGPVSTSGNGNSNRSSGKSTSKPSPILAPSSGGSGARNGGRFSSTGSSGSLGNAGNPSPGNPKGAPGIDAIREPDFGPYMKEVERRIKSNWTPPNGGQNKKIVLLFKIAKDGRLLSLSVQKSSGSKSDDDAAIAAVKLTAPFRPLPPEYKGASVDINFTFDFYASSARRY